MALGLGLEPGRLGGLGLGFRLGSSGACRRLVGERFSLVHLGDMRGDVFPDALGLYVLTLGALASGEDQRRSHDDDRDGDDDPDDNGALHGGSSHRRNPGPSLTRPLISGFPSTPPPKLKAP